MPTLQNSLLKSLDMFYEDKELMTQKVYQENELNQVKSKFDHLRFRLLMESLRNVHMNRDANKYSIDIT